MKKVHLLLIDPQEDFVSPSGSLCVPGADADAKTLAKLSEFVIKSISAQSQALGTGGPSEPTSLSI